MRYFFISYAHDKGFGTIELILDTFPNHDGVINSVKEQDQTIQNVTVLSVFEFENKEDFNEWTGIVS